MKPKEGVENIIPGEAEGERPVLHRVTYHLEELVIYPNKNIGNYKDLLNNQWSKQFNEIFKHLL